LLKVVLNGWDISAIHFLPIAEIVLGLGLYRLTITSFCRAILTVAIIRASLAVTVLACHDFLVLFFGLPPLPKLSDLFLEGDMTTKFE
jgi:hypothetical protein